MSDLGLNLRGRVAVVTGGSRGIGRAVVERLAEAGVNVSINYVRGEAAAAEAKRTAEGFGVRAEIIRGDVSSVAEALAVARATFEKFGRLDVLVCNAGLWEGAPVEEMNEDLWGRVLDTNLKGTWAACRAAVPYMKRQAFGRIVIVSSTAGQRGEAYYSNYAASKGGQISFAKSLAVELAPNGINVNAVAPGWVSTEMTADALSEEGERRAVEDSIPLRRIASPDEIARPVVFLCSDWARHITGEVLNVNGGSVLCG
ncbi:MAG TPA: 3-oxoacyl-ACP reductase family protein [Pyrinomonadaceae bacterium]|nr:3-oxoacyl-ACP reductase family protein [Pyrinomonadaceae bacterium]